MKAVYALKLMVAMAGLTALPVAWAVTPMIGAGGYHTCALTSSGGVECWGSNSQGQLGNGNTASSASPVAVSGLSSGVAAISVGYDHSCALTTAGAPKCWGNDLDGELGNGTTSLGGFSVPVPVTGLSSGVIAVAAGSQWHTCALTSAGSVLCWGANGNGQLGNGTTASSTVPVAVSGLTGGVVAIAVGGYHTCALTDVGAVECWGDNLYGELGNGTSNNIATTPIAVSGLSSGVVAIAAGFNHTCALTDVGVVQCWGDNSVGEGGNGTSNNISTTPVAVTGLADVVAITSGGGASHTCALTYAGGVECWGFNSFGQLGNGSPYYFVTTPVAVSGLSSIVSISAGAAHTCALSSAGAVNCWGYNGTGQLGNGLLNIGSTVALTAQAITFNPLANKALATAPFTVSATASSGRVVAFSSTTPNICTVSGNVLTLVAQGTCTIAAHQLGDATYAAAPTVTQSFFVSTGTVPIGTRITALPYVISTPGIYYIDQKLSTNLGSGAAITINANNVVLDLNANAIGNLAAGLATQAIGILADSRQNVTVRNGIVRGFYAGVALAEITTPGASSGNAVDGVTADQSRAVGIQVDGTGSVVRHSRVVSTNGSTAPPLWSGVVTNSASGIVVTGAGAQVNDNEVINTDCSNSCLSGSQALGIAIANAPGAVLTENRILNGSLATATTSVAINVDATAPDAFADTNYLAGYGYGIVFGGIGKYRDTLTNNVTIPYSGGTAVDSNN